MSADPGEFLTLWALEHVQPTGYDDHRTAKQLADQCLAEAHRVGIPAASLRKAAGGDLEHYMLRELNRAADKEVNRTVGKDEG